VVWCNGGGDSGGYSPGVLKSTTNDECRSSFGCSHTWAVVFVCGCSLTYVGGRLRFRSWACRFRTWAAVFVCGRIVVGRGGLSSYVGGRLRT
jgi:hypothetical protein